MKKSPVLSNDGNKWSLIEKLQQLDRDLFIFLNGLGIENYDAFWIAVTQPETWIPLYIIFVLTTIWAFKPDWKKIMVSLIGAGASLGITVLLTNLVKNTISRMRPNNVAEFHDLIRILQKPETFSFFSAHASTSMVVATFMVLLLRKQFYWVYLFFLWPILFSWSRIYVGVHYPSDILIGLLVGFLIALLGIYLTKRVNEGLTYKKGSKF